MWPRRQSAPDPIRTLRRRNVLIGIALVALTVTLGALDQRGWLLVGDVDDLRRYDQHTAVVLRVLDDGLLEIDARDGLHRSAATWVRITGITLPRNARPTIVWLEANCHGMPITLDLEPQRTRDDRGNLLAHVMLEESVSLGGVLLQTGLAERDERWPHMRLIEYAQFEQAARSRRIGCWARR